MCDDEQAALTTRIKRIRAAHRGAVTRLINQMDEALLAADIGRLKQLRQSLKNKIDVLLKLDEELLLSVGEDELDYEIEQADVVRERAELAVIGLDEALTKISRRSEKRSLLHGRSPSSSNSEGEGHPGLSHPSLATNGDEPDIPPSCQPHQTTSEPLSILPRFGARTPTSVTPFSLSPSWTFTFPSMSTVREALPTHTTVSSVSGSHLHSSSIGLFPRASKQGSGEPVLPVCTTNVTRVCVSHTVSTVPSPQITEHSRVHFTHDTSGICTPGTVASVPSRVMLPEIPTMVVPHSPPPLIPSTVYDAAWSSTHTERNAHVQATDYNRPASNMTPYSSFGFEPMQAAGHAMPAPSLYPYSGFGFNPSTSACRTTPLSVSSTGTRVQIVDPSPMPSVVSHPYVTPVCPTPTPPVLPTVIPPAPAPAPAHTVTPHVKLPKLSMKKFNGDLTFWDSFSSSIDANPALSGIDKFNYLISLLESTAAEAIAGLTPTDANYEEAVATLKKRFGNPQLIINRHMEALLHVPSVSSHHDIRGLRKLHDSVESHIRGLKALRVPAQTYGGLLISVLVNKLPPELRLIVTREMTGEAWDLERLLRIFEQEIDARERAFVPTSQSNVRRPRVPTASTLLANSPGSNGNRVVCVYCEKDHVSSSCNTITDVAARKELLRKSGRCFVCLKRHHLSRDCRSNFNCKKCRGRHHVSICVRTTNRSGGKNPTTQGGSEKSQGGDNSAVPMTTCYVGSQTPILLQTAKLRLVNPNGQNPETSARAILDSGSQRMYVTSHVREKLKLPAIATETIQIKTFGNSESYDKTCDVVSFGVRVKSGETLEIADVGDSSPCSPIDLQPIDLTANHHFRRVSQTLAGLGAC